MKQTVVPCSNCNKKLAIFVVTKPDEVNPVTNQTLRTKVRVKCCYCADSSFLHEIVGKFVYSGYHVERSEDEVDEKTYLEYDGIVRDIVQFKAVKQS